MVEFHPAQLLIVPALAFLGRVAGASWGPRQVGEVSAALIVTYFSWHLYEFAWYYGLPIAAFTYAGLQAGHGNVYHMGTEAGLPNSPRSLDRRFGWLGKRLDFPPRSVKYCWLLMGIKGLWIGLAVFPFGLLNAYYWPASYNLSFKKWGTSLYAEWISHGCLGLILLIAYYIG